MKRLIILSVLSIVLVTNTYTQEYYQLEEMFLDADSWFFYEDYEEALPLFLRVLDADSLNYNVMYKIGFCYLHIPGQKHKSIPYLENAINKTTFNYRKNTYTEKEAPVDALFYLGNAYLVDNRINEAIDAYSGFQNAISRTQKAANKDIFDMEYVQRQFDACRNAIQFQYEPISFVAKNIGNKINTRFNEFNAVVSGDGSTLVFTASLQFYDAIFYSKKDSTGQWSYPINLMGQLGVDDNSATTGLSYDGTELYIYRDDDFDGNIYVSYFKDGLWSKVRKLGENINTKYWESHASVSPDNNTLYFVSNRDGGFGDLDIYVSERSTDTTWGKAKNLGEVINTQWNENTPFLTPDGKRLFFSSEGHQGMGGYDIFYSELSENQNWTEPVNIGYPINTTDNDIFFVPFESGKFAYSSQFSKQGYGGQDIYHYQLFHIPDYDNILVEGIMEMDNKVDRNKKDFSINIIDQTKNDTIAVLKPETDQLNYQYRTPLGKNHLVFESSFNENETQYFISTEYDIKEVFQSSIDQQKEIAAIDMPAISLDTNIVKTDQEHIKIKLSLQKGNKLIVHTFYKDQLINTEEFDIKKEDFIYEYKPLIGESKIQFTLVDKNNNVKSEEVTVSYLPQDTRAELSIAEKIISFGANGDKTVKIKLSVEKGSKLFVETFVDNKLVNTEEFNVRKESFIYEFKPEGERSKLNFKLVDKYNNVSNQEVIVSHKPVNKDFAEVLNGIVSFNNKGLKDVIQSNDVISLSTVEDLMSHIYSKAAALGLSKEQAQAIIIALSINSTEDTKHFIASLVKIAEGDLKTVLDSIQSNQENYKTNLSVIEQLELQSNRYNYNNKDIIRLLENYLQQSNISTRVLLSKLEILLNTDIASILNNLDAKAINIITLDDFKKYLTESGKYTDQELSQFYAIMEGILIANKASVEIETIPEQEPVATKDSQKNTNIWLLIMASLSGIIIALIIIYFNRRRNKGNK